MSRTKLLFSGCLALIVLHAYLLLGQERPSASVEQALTNFIASFDNLDWPEFRECFSTSATIFHPSAPNVRRIDTPDQFEQAWLGVFERIKKSSGRNAPPYMDLKPLDLRVENLSENVALVTFHLIDGNILNRRTLIFKRDASGWKIVHIHASNLTQP